MTIDQQLLNAAEDLELAAVGLQTVVVNQVTAIKDQAQTFAGQALGSANAASASASAAAASAASIAGGPVASVAGKTGIVSLVKADVGLSNVDNTSDATKNSAVATLTNKTLTTPTITTPVINNGYTEQIFSITGTTPTIAASNGSIQTWTLSGNSTVTDGLANGQSVILGITASSFTVTWPTMTWAKVGGSGTAPTLTSSGINWIVLWETGSTLRGAFLGTT